MMGKCIFYHANKIVLGTAQFGMDYGINNKRGKIPKDEVFEIFNLALKSGVNTLDTAYSYGESETIIGEFTAEYKKEFQIISKLPKCELSEVEKILNSSLFKLNIDTIYGYMIHNFQYYIENPRIWNILEIMKLNGKIKKIGISLYYPYELEYLIKNGIKIDLIQVPYSIFDQRFEQYISELKNSGVEIYVRSVFLQGLFFKNPDELTGDFEKIKEKIAHLTLLSTKLNVPIAALCINFAILNEFVDRVVVGVDSIDNFRDIISSSKYIAGTKKVLSELYSFKENDENIILPLNWKVIKNDYNCNNPSKNWINQTSSKSLTRTSR